MNILNYEAPPTVPFWSDPAKVRGLGLAISLSANIMLLRDVNAIGIFGSRSTGDESAWDDFDVCIVPTGATRVWRGICSQAQGPPVPAIEVVARPHAWALAEHALTGHLSKYCQWKPPTMIGGLGCEYGPLRAALPETIFVPPTRIMLPRIRSGLNTRTKWWYMLVRREILRGILEYLRHPSPPNSTLDKMWADDATPRQAREIVDDLYGPGAFDAMHDTRVSWCAICAGLASASTEVRAEEGPLAGTHSCLPKEEALHYFCSNDCERDWTSARILTGSTEWSLLPQRRSAFLRPGP